ncbi:uncharacterized protein LOC119436504 isoform X1 [Dermacentor silvarum]|uniref:uncharacterized protein LOC119436504 isoform X1 n=2 Tax=Dermacentor silvarum TaxID=543639 RepID=UPI002100B82E|nr:uncharacterized protein LOC119436504 isoform X1 [Dermacentor silvarum]
MASYMLPNFDDLTDKWKPYLIKVEAYFEANAISDSTKKRALLVAALSTSTVQILMGRIAPAKPNALSYDEVVKVLNDHYDPKRNEIAESFQFFNRCQHENESIQDFVVAIRRIADNCNFGDSLTRLLRDRIVCGVRSSAVQKQLLAKNDLTLEEAESIAIAAETAEKDARTMSVEVPPVLKVEAHRKLPSRSSVGSAEKLECGRCGSSRHDSSSCRWTKARCYSCGQRGHLAKMCHNRNGNDVPSNRRVPHAKALVVEDAALEEDSSDSVQIWTLASARKNSLEPPIRRTFSWGGVDLPMEVDTGSPVCVISRQLFDKHRKCWPSLKPSHVKLSCYNGRLPVMGELQLRVKYRDISVDCSLVVLDCPGPSLCGRDLLILLEQAGVPVLRVTCEGEATESQVNCHNINAIRDTYQDVFSETLGLIKGPPASLLLKGDAVPKFCREFILVTDHQPLLGLLRPDRQTPAMAAARIQRWALYLGGYRYKLEYAPGRLLLNADALSRLPLRCPNSVTEPDPEEYVLSLESLDEGIVTTRELKELTANDPTLGRVKQNVLHGWPKGVERLDPSLAPFADRKLELSLAHDLVYWGHRVVIPVAARKRLLQLLHETHQGSSAMKTVARSLFWWPGIDREIELTAAQCKNCIDNLPMPPAAPPLNWPQTQERWSRVHVDFAGPIQGKMVLVVVDSHTKWIEAVPLNQATSATTIDCLRDIFSHFGVPRTLVSDNGTQFTSQEFATFANKNNITHLRTAPYHPQSNGAAERAVRTIKDGLRKMRGGKLEHNLVRLLLNYRRTPQKTGKSPSEMLLGYQIRSRLDACFPASTVTNSKGNDEWLPPIDCGVHVRNYGSNGKWIPGRVTATAGGRMVTVETPQAIVRRHIDQVRARTGSSQDEPPGTDPDTFSSDITPSAPPFCQQPSASPDEARESSPPEAFPDVAHQGPLPRLVASGADELTTQPLRRSTRSRKPVQRF